MAGKIPLASIALIIGICYGLNLGASTVCIAQVPDDNASQAQRLVQVDMTDETRVIGVPDMDQLNLDLEFGKIAIPVDLIRAIQVGKKRPNEGRTRFLISLRNNDRFSGTVLNESVKLQFSAGEVTLPFDQIKSFRWLSANQSTGVLDPASTILFFDFENNTNTVVNNSASPRHHGKLNNVDLRPSNDDRRKKVAVFKGDGSFTVKHHQNLCPPKFTLSAWIRPGGDRSNYTFIAGKSAGEWTDGYAFTNFNNDPHHVHFFINGYQAQRTKAAVPSNQWSHLTGTCDGKTMILYLNGKEVDRSTFANGVTVNHSNGPFTIGADTIGGNWTGEVDNVALHNRDLSAAEVRELFEGQK